MLARVQRRRGRCAAAVGHFENAAADALRCYHPLLALRAGLECGGDVGGALVDAAAARMLRSRAELLAEYGAACGTEVVKGWLAAGPMEQIAEELEGVSAKLNPSAAKINQFTSKRSLYENLSEPSGRDEWLAP